MLSYLDIINQVDSVPYENQANAKELSLCYTFESSDHVALGYVLPFVAEKLRKTDPQIVTVDSDKLTITINPELKTLEDRSKAFAKVIEGWRQHGDFEALKGWRNELYTVYNPSHTPYLLIERSASCLFGIVTYGVHIIGYVPNKTTKEPEKIWVPRRSRTKPTYPGMLDNTVAGGIGHPYGIFETAIKECGEEAGLDEDYVKSHIKPAGAVTYFFREATDSINTEKAVFQPEVEYLYDIVMEDSVVPKPVDGEVEEFSLMSIAEVKQELSKGSFKYNTGLITIDFFVRHGLIDPENEPDYAEIVSRVHRRLPYPLR